MLIIISISCLITTANVASFKSLIYLTGPAGSVQRFNENSRESHGSSAAVNVLILKFYAGLHSELLCSRERGSLRGGNRLLFRTFKRRARCCTRCSPPFFRRNENVTTKRTTLLNDLPVSQKRFIYDIDESSREKRLWKFFSSFFFFFFIKITTEQNAIAICNSLFL